MRQKQPILGVEVLNNRVINICSAQAREAYRWKEGIVGYVNTGMHLSAIVNRLKQSTYRTGSFAIAETSLFSVSFSQSVILR